MKTKKTTQENQEVIEQLSNTKTKPKSLRPMRSMVAVRSFKPKTVVAAMPIKASEQLQAN